jgi:hypothetical protein
MQHQDVARRQAAGQSSQNGVGIGRHSVVSAPRPADERKSELPQHRFQPRSAYSHRRPKEGGCTAGKLGQQILRPADLSGQTARQTKRKAIRVTKRVVLYEMPARGDFPHETRIAHRSRANTEEARGRAVPIQDIEDFRSSDRVRTVIERQRHLTSRTGLGRQPHDIWPEQTVAR